MRSEGKERGEMVREMDRYGTERQVTVRSRGLWLMALILSALPPQHS